MITKKPSKRFLFLAFLILLIIGLVSGMLISPMAGVFFASVLGVYAMGFYIYSYSQGFLRRAIAITGIIVFMVGMYYVAEKREREAREYDEEMTRITEQQVKPMTYEEIETMFEQKK